MPNLDRAESSGHVSEGQEEARKIRRLQVMIGMVMSVIGQDPNLTIEEASELAAGAKRAALAMFPDKELAYDILYKPLLFLAGQMSTQIPHPVQSSGATWMVNFM